MGPLDAVFLAAGPPLMASPGLPGSQPDSIKPIIKGLSRHKRPNLQTPLQLSVLLSRNSSASLRSAPSHWLRVAGEANPQQPPMKGEVALPEAGPEGSHGVCPDL